VYQQRCASSRTDPQNSTRGARCLRPDARLLTSAKRYAQRMLGLGVFLGLHWMDEQSRRPVGWRIVRPVDYVAGKRVSDLIQTHGFELDGVLGRRDLLDGGGGDKPARRAGGLMVAASSMT